MELKKLQPNPTKTTSKYLHTKSNKGALKNYTWPPKTPCPPAIITKIQKRARSAKRAKNTKRFKKCTCTPSISTSYLFQNPQLFK